MEHSLAGAVDLHVHCGPEAIPRRYNALQLSQVLLDYKIRAGVIKSHFHNTTPWAFMAAQHVVFNLYGSVVLNHYLGGINPGAVRAALGLEWEGTPLLKIVWMPTTHAYGHLKMREKQGAAFDIPEEWTGGKPSAGRQPLSQIEPIFIKSPKLEAALHEVLDLIAANKLVLATGHLTADEITYLVPLAKKRGVNKIIITHPLYPPIALKSSELKDLVAFEGVYVEQTFALYLLDNIPVETMVEQIRAVGIDASIITTDLGQQMTVPPPEGLLQFIAILKKQGLQEEDIDRMVKHNPAYVLDFAP